MRTRNCLILGSGRSGTSLLAGTLRGAGYYVGECLIEANDANPKGFFEDYEVNAINEELLTPMTPTYSYGWRWLAAIPIGTPLPCQDAVNARIEAQTARAPFCFKDPRFCYTLPAWRPFLPETAFLCVFREPSRTANSILKECRTAPYLAGLRIDFARAVEIWRLMYRHVLDVHRQVGHWLFVHYDQLVTGVALARIEAMLGVSADRSFPDPALKRSAREGPTDAAALRVYRELCDLAGYRE
jgi:hypothetical protein